MALSPACRFDGDTLPGAPRVYAVDTRGAHAGAPEDERRRARAQARAALRQGLAAALGCAPDALAIGDVRGQAPRLAWRGAGAAPALDAIGLSISHAPGLSLAAWCPAGMVGIDVQAVPHDASHAELWRTAALFFTSNRLAALEQQAQEAPFIEAFARHWTAHEAALKCLGLALQEGSPALAGRLAGVRVAPLALPPGSRADLVAALAWRPADRARARDASDS